VATGAAFPFVRIEENQTLSFNQAALHVLSALPAPVCVLSMSGTARDGKSTWLNMYDDWLRMQWGIRSRGNANGFKVGHDLDTCTEGSWMRVLKGKDGAPLPGTDCSSIILLDTQGLGRGRLEGLHRLFTLSLMLSSTVGINVMRQFNDDALERLGEAIAHARATLPEQPHGGDAPNLMVLVRDVRLRLQQAGRPVLPDAMLYAALQPVGDKLDTTREAVHRFFFNRTMFQMKQPEDHDLAAMTRGSFPPRGSPFYQSFIAAAQHATSTLRPKVASGVALSGEFLAIAAKRLAHQLNTHAHSAVKSVSLESTVGSMLRLQAEEAVARARRVFSESATPWQRDSSESSAVFYSAASLEMSIRNATQVALDEFNRAVPQLVDDAETLAFLRPYAEALRTYIAAAQLQLRQTHEHAIRLSTATTVERRLRAEAEMARVHSQRLMQAAQQEQRHHFLSNAIMFALSASTLFFFPVASQRTFFSKLAPALKVAPPVLAFCGMWRVARTSLGSAISKVVNSVNNLSVVNSVRSRFFPVVAQDSGADTTRVGPTNNWLSKVRKAMNLVVQQKPALLVD